MAGERGGFRTDALHQAAVAADGVDVVVEHLVARLVVPAGQPLARDRHADAGGNPLTQRTGRRLHTRDPVILRMPRRLAVELAEMADVIERDRWLAQTLVLSVHRTGARQVQDRPQQHRGVAVRQDEAVAIGPDRVLGIEAHDPVPQRVDQRGQRHRRAGVARLRLLDGVDGEGSDRIDRQLIEILLGHAVSASVTVPLSGSIRIWRNPLFPTTRRASRCVRRTGSAWRTAPCPRSPPRRAS